MVHPPPGSLKIRADSLKYCTEGCMSCYCRRSDRQAPRAKRGSHGNSARRVEGNFVPKSTVLFLNLFWRLQSSQKPSSMKDPPPNTKATNEMAISKICLCVRIIRIPKPHPTHMYKLISTTYWREVILDDGWVQYVSRQLVARPASEEWPNSC